jgi:hypothetical protein
MSNVIRGDIRRVRNTQKRSRSEADEYYVAHLQDSDGTETGIMLTRRELKIAVSRYWKNREDQPAVKPKGLFKRILDELF